MASQITHRAATAITCQFRKCNGNAFCDTTLKKRGFNAIVAQEERSLPKKGDESNANEFSKIVKRDTFVDKSLFIKAFLEDKQKVIALMAPRRFGKSTNMNMLREFLSGNDKLFKDHQLKIWKEERDFFDKHCHENPVLHLDFNDVSSETKDQLLQSLRDFISEKFSDHNYLIDEKDGQYSWSSETKLKPKREIDYLKKYWEEPENLSENDVKLGLKRLTQCLYHYHGKRVYVLLDECDSPVMEMLMAKNTVQEFVSENIDLINKLMCSLFKGNPYLEKGLLTGCLRIAQALSSRANNIKWCEVLSHPSFSPFYGFTDHEVNSLFEKKQFAPFKNDNIQKWYNGYKLRHTDDYRIYCSFSILNYLEESTIFNVPQFDRYWVGTGSTMRLKELFGQPLIHKYMKDLIAGHNVKIRTIVQFTADDIFNLKRMLHIKLQSIDYKDSDRIGNDNTHLFFQFLTESGYFTVISSHDCESTIRIPNEEVRTFMEENCYNADFYMEKYKYSSDDVHNYRSALLSLLERSDKEAFTTFAKAISKLFNKKVIPTCEAELQSVLYTISNDIMELEVHIEVNIENSPGPGRSCRLDVIMISHNTGVILELKFKAGSSEAAYNQIIEKKYGKAFENYKNLKNKILIGLHMNEQTADVKLTYSVNDSPTENV